MSLATPAPPLIRPCVASAWHAGEEPHTGIIAGITPGNPTLVTTVEDERLEFQDGALPPLCASALLPRA